MADDFDPGEFLRFQESLLARIRETQRMLTSEILEYYSASQPADPEAAYRNLRGMHNYVKDAWKSLENTLTRIEGRKEWR